MRNYLLILVLIPSALGAQMKFSKALKKLGLDSNEVLYTNEQILLFPRAMIYDLQDTDSIAYLGCVSTDQMDFINYFEKGTKALKLPIGTKLQRRFEDDVDTILFEPFIQKVKRFRYPEESKSFRPNEGIRYAILFYWSVSTIDRHILKNYRFFSKYLDRHPEIKAQLIPVCSDQY